MKKSKHRIVFRADGSSTTGLGHVMRSLALAEMLAEQFECSMLTKAPSVALLNMMKAICDPVNVLVAETIDQELVEIGNYLKNSDILVLDGYEFDSGYQATVRSSVHRLVCIDDTASVFFHAHMIINHGGTWLKEQYQCSPGTRLLLGFPYLMLRKAFLQAAGSSAKKKQTERKAFICMGGADPINLTVRILEAALTSAFFDKIIVVIGSAYMHGDSLNKIMRLRQQVVTIEQNVPAERMVELLENCSLAICPASTTAMEICCVGVPLLTGITADNQHNLALQITRAGCAVFAGDLNGLSEGEMIKNMETALNWETSQKILQHQAEAIDGQSGKRLKEAFQWLETC